MFIIFHFLSTNCLELGLEMYRCVNFLNEELLSLRNNDCQKVCVNGTSVALRTCEKRVLQIIRMLCSNYNSDYLIVLLHVFTMDMDIRSHIPGQ